MLTIDVEGRAGGGRPALGAPVVVVEPLLGGPAVVLAVENAGSCDMRSGVGAVPHLGSMIDGVSTDDPLRVDDLVRALRSEHELGADEALIVSHLNLRPCAALLGAWLSERDDVGRVRIACAETSEGDIAADAMQLAGALARLLLDEVTRPVTLSEAAGMAMTISESYPEAVAALESGGRWRRFQRDSDLDMETPVIAATHDQCAAVPLVKLTADRLVAESWTPDAPPSSDD